jgi:alkanesulfonate monooxygenase SsuD/methylene tetrahydromethanopterin reductase-like flavin-dependent oxidoreductase (luciferase family)
MNLEFGLFDTVGAESGGGGLGEAYHTHIADAALCEQLGYRYYFFIEHQNARFPVITSPTVYLSALAAATTTLRIGAMVLQLPMHHPIRLAQDTAMVDQLSRGRFEFALGYGTRLPEFEPWFLDYEHRREIGNEVMAVVLEAWSGREVTHEGEYFRFKNAVVQPRPFQKPHPPVWVGAHSATSIAYAVENGFNMAQNLDAEKTTAEKFQLFRDMWAEKKPSQPLPRTLLVRHVHVADTDAEARKNAEPHMLKGLLGEQGVARALSLKPEEKNPVMLEMARIYLETAKSYDFWIDEGLAFIGSPETVVRQIRAQQERCGYDILLAQHQITTMPRDAKMRSMQLFGEAVIPKFGLVKA